MDTGSASGEGRSTGGGQTSPQDTTSVVVAVGAVGAVGESPSVHPRARVVIASAYAHSR